jgi:hypothetical protein
MKRYCIYQYQQIYENTKFRHGYLIVWSVPSRTQKYKQRLLSRSCSFSVLCLQLLICKQRLWWTQGIVFMCHGKVPTSRSTVTCSQKEVHFFFKKKDPPVPCVAPGGDTGGTAAAACCLCSCCRSPLAPFFHVLGILAAARGAGSIH